MAEVRPDEVSAILRQQLSGFSTEAQLEEVGTVLQVGDGIARIYGMTQVQAGELIEFENGFRWNGIEPSGEGQTKKGASP